MKRNVQDVIRDADNADFARKINWLSQAEQDLVEAIKGIAAAVRPGWSDIVIHRLASIGSSV